LPSGGGMVKQIPYSQFLTMVEEGKVESVEITGNELKILPKATGDADQPLYYTARMVENEALSQQLFRAGVEFAEVEQTQRMSIFDIIIVYVIPIALFGLMIFWIVSLIRGMKKGEGGRRRHRRSVRLC
jgi:cell division protease FtsH